MSHSANADAHKADLEISEFPSGKKINNHAVSGLRDLNKPSAHSFFLCATAANQLQGPVSEPPGPHSDCRCCRSHPVSDRGGLESDGVERDLMFTAAASTGRDSRFVLAQTSNANSSPVPLLWRSNCMSAHFLWQNSASTYIFFPTPKIQNTDTHTKKQNAPKKQTKKSPRQLSGTVFSSDGWQMFLQ